MKKFYLLILTAFIAIGAVHAKGDFSLYYGNNGSSFQDAGDPEYDSYRSTDNDKWYKFEVTANGSLIQFYIQNNNGGTRTLKTSSTAENEPGTQIIFRHESAKDSNGELTNNIAKYKVTNGKKYTIWLNYRAQGRNEETDKNTDHYVTLQEGGTGGGGTVTPTPDYELVDYYFYGDMNRWSALEHNGGPFDTSAAPESDFPDGAPDHVNWDDLKTYWKFKPVDKAHEVSETRDRGGNEIKIKEGEGWYYLDFAEVTDATGNSGRLCGQFKITMGTTTKNSNNWGHFQTSANQYYFESSVSVGYLYGVGKGDAVKNLYLGSNVIEGACIYFHPTYQEDYKDAPKIYITGTEVNKYVYYASNKHGNVYSQPADWEFSNLSQLLYDVDVDVFNNKNTEWEKVTASTPSLPSEYIKGDKITYRGNDFDYVWRRKIPAGANHRFPTPFSVKVKNCDGSVSFPQADINCNDLWFVETNKTVKLHFRYDNDNVTQAINWVAYNAFNKTRDAQTGATNGYVYLFGGNKSTAHDVQPLMSNGEWGTMVLDAEKTVAPGETQAHFWWSTPVGIPAAFAANSFAMFGDSRGGIYPPNRVQAPTNDLTDVTIDGNDVWFTAASFENPSLLYSHLNGTFHLDSSESKTVQINAEFFDPETVGTAFPALISNTADVRYRFEVYRDAVLVDYNTPDTANGTYTRRPYFDWNMSGTDKLGNPYAPGYYLIVVKAEYNGTVYTAQDTYVVY